MNLTRHAENRMQQRGINRQAVDYVLAYGRESYGHHGCQVVWLDKQARRRIRDEESEEMARKLDKCLNTYAVIDQNGTVITVGHRYRRIWRH
ncbi:MAG: DUF4258 domain-containing protein [Gammaproteobacteria bacterium]|nr:DUF4258 domain-containing protein [Gammaproteobacteria bacterium]MDP6734349.1 DUF4258 domain-containing protein [Gammaproteobacteria bacterium]